MRKNRFLYDILIEKVWYWGIWLWTDVDGRKIIVKWWVFPWFIVDCKVEKKKKDFIQAKLIEIKSYWNLVKEKVCSHYNEWCWWCKWSIISYSEQVKYKRELILDSFRSMPNFLNKFSDFEMIHSPNQWNYRNKIEFSFWKIFPEQQWNLGFHKQWMFSKVIDVNECYLISEKMHSIFSYLKNIFKDSWLPVYDQKIHEWFFRHLVIREGSNKSILINLSVSDKYFIDNPEKKDVWISMLNFFNNDEFLKDNINSFYITYNNSLADAVKWSDIKLDLLFWEKYIVQTISFDNVSVDFQVGPFSFFQTNTECATELFKTAFDMIWPVDWNILDLYCWAWAVWLSYMKYFNITNSKLFWIEIVSDAIDNAKVNANLNWLDKVSYFVDGQCHKVFQNDDVIKNNTSDLDLIIIDPPRSWLEKDVIEFLVSLKEKKKYKLLYISCNPVTMSRDISLLEQADFELVSFKAVDMFPNTHHIESIWLLL